MTITTAAPAARTTSSTITHASPTIGATPVVGTSLAPTSEAATAYSLPGVSWLSLAVQGTDGVLTVGPTSIGVHVTPPAQGAPARVDVDLSQVTLAALSAAAVADGSADPLGALPGALAAVLSEVAISRVSVGVDLDAHRLTDIALTVAAGSPWQLVPDHLELDGLEVTLTVTRAATSTTIEVSGRATFAGAAVVLNIAHDSAAQGGAAWTVHAGLAPDATLSASAVAAAYGVGLPANLPELALSGCALDAVLDGSAVTFTATSPTEWTLPVGPDGLGVGQIGVSFAVAAAASEGADGGGSESASSRTVTGSVTGVVHLGGVDVPVSFTVPGGLTLHATIPEVAPFALLQDVCGAVAVGSLSLPPELLALTLTDLELSIDVEHGQVSFAASGPGFHRVQAVARKATTWGFAVGIELDDNYRFSSLSPALGGLDAVHLPDALIVISSFADAAFRFDELQPIAGTGVSRGLLVDGRLDLSGLGADRFLGESHLDVKAEVGTSLADLRLEAGVGDVTITDGVVLKDAEFTLVPDPENISVSVSGAVDVTIDSSPLEFVGGVEVVPNGISFFATMTGTWQDPFGAKGIALRDVSLKIGSDFEGVPSIGIAGGLSIGAFEGTAAVSFNSALPSQSVLIVAFNHLALLDVVDTFCPPTVAASIPADVSATLAGISLEDVDLYVVPQDTTIGALRYDQGLRVGGTLHVAGFTAQAKVEIDQEDGIAASGSLNPITIGDVFALTGTDPAKGPDLDIEVKATAVPKVEFSGQVNLLGVGASAAVSLSDQGFSFDCKGRVFGVFDADISAKGGSLQSGSGFMVHAAFHQSFLDDVARRAAAVLQQAGADAQAQLTSAQHAVDSAKADVQRFSASVDSAKADLAAKQAAAQSQIQALSDQVTQAQHSLGAVDAQIAATRAQIQSERDAAASRLNDLRQKLAAAQSSVDSLNAQIGAQQAQINQLNSDIAWWNNWYNNLAWYDKTWGWAQLGAEVGWRGTQVAALTVAIQGLRGSLVAANGVLQAAQQAVNAAQAAAATYPIDQDPRILGLQGGRGAAQLALQGAQGALDAARQSTAIGIGLATQTLTGFMQQLGTAMSTLQTVNAGLDHLSQTIGDVAAVAGYIAEHGLGALLDVRSASFTGTLDATSGGSVTLDADVVWQGTATSVHVAYDFHDLAAGAKALAKEVLPSLPV